jgi:hypothetical protein
MPANTAPYPNSQLVTLTTSGAGYIAGDVVQGIISLGSATAPINIASGRRVVLKSVQVNDKSGVSPNLTLYFFKSTPTGGTYTDNSPLVWGTGDYALKVGQVSILNANYLTDISQSSQNISGLTMGMDVTATTLFLLVLAEGSYTLAASSYSVLLEFDQQ